MKSLKKIIKKLLPYYHCHYVILTLFVLFAAIFGSAIALTFAQVEPILYDQTNLYDYMYADIDKIYSVSDNLYIANDDQYIYVYRDNTTSQDVLSSKTITGVPSYLSENDYEKILPSFQKRFPDLKVMTVKQMKEYVGLYALDKTLPQFHTSISFLALISLIPFLILLIYVFRVIYYHIKISSSLKLIIERHEEGEVRKQLSESVYKFDSIKTLLLRNYLVINHPVPYIIAYDDIQWIYLEKKKFLFLFDKEINLVIHDSQFKKTKVLFATGLNKAEKWDCDELVDFISTINSSLLVGYNMKNRQQFYLKKREYEKSGVK